MAHLIANVPSVLCYIRKEYLYNFEKDSSGKLKGLGEFEECYWVSIKSIKGRALYFESFVTKYGAVYDKLPISAYVWKTDIKESEQLPLDYLQIWDCFSYNVTVLEKDFLKQMTCKVLMKDKKYQSGMYMFTIDSYHSDPNVVNTTLSETPNEHKSFNIIKLDNGQFAAQPNNRIIYHNASFTPHQNEIPYFKLSTKVWTCENSDKWTAANDNNYFYQFTEK